MKKLTRFRDFGDELRRAFDAHELCYDCAAFYDGCDAWPATRKFTCPYQQKLPDVMPGTYGQPWPEKVYVPRDPRSGGEVPQFLQAMPHHTATIRSVRGNIDRKAAGSRRCACGMPLAKGKQYCDDCRQQNRRESKREYMRDYMRARRTA